jgi:cytoskeletal protein CcmA (bactofilin family)
MKIFRSKQTMSADITNISERARLEGKLESAGTLIISGSFTGSIKSSTLDICKDGRVNGSIKANNVTIGGYFEGELACSGLLTIAKTGTVRGRVAYGTLSVELGGLLDAEVFQLESKDTKLVPFHPKGVHSDK